MEVALDALSFKSTLIVWLRKFDFQLSVFSSVHDHVKVQLTEQNVIVNTGRKVSLYCQTYNYEIIILMME